jgi:hypothetical protein
MANASTPFRIMMKTALLYAFGLSLANALIILLSSLLGYHNDPARFQTGQVVSVVAGSLVAIAALVLGMQAVRAESPNQALSYGRAIGTGALISAFSGAMSGALVYVYGKFINPEFHQVMYEVQVAEMSARMTASQIEQAEPMMRFLTSAGWIASTQLLFSTVFGVILSAIVGLFLKRAPRESPPAVPAA